MPINTWYNHGSQIQCLIKREMQIILQPNLHQIFYRVRLKKMTQHVKCDYLVTPENVCTKFGRII